VTFYEILEQALTLIQQHGRVTYRALKRHFDLDDDYLEDLKDEIIKARQLAVDHDGELLVWVGPPAPPSSAASLLSEGPEPRASRVSSSSAGGPTARPGERRQLTVMFCDLVESTALAARLDPEDWREVVRAYQETCADIVQRLSGHVAQYLGDGLLVYFGYPQAHEDDAQRAVRAGLAILKALERLNTRLQRERGVRLALRIGVHTGLVVMGEMGYGGQQQQLALGETPNVAAHVQGLATPNTVMISSATARLVQGYFACHDLGVYALKGVAAPMQLYRVLGESAAQSRFEVATALGLTPLVGREQEVELLLESWGQAKDGQGHVILLSGEAGIGKTRLVQVVKDHVASMPHIRWECRCSPYYRNSAFYPVIELMQQLCRFHREDSVNEKRRKLERALALYITTPDALPLLASLLSLPADTASPPRVTPEQYKQRILEVIRELLLAHATQHPVLLVIEDVHYADPSTCELLEYLLEPIASASVLMVLAFRSTFQPPWTLRAHMTALTLNRLSRVQVESMIARITRGKALPPDVHRQLVVKTDGVPLFVEELTKMVLESGMLREYDEHYELTGPLVSLTIPTTLQDSLMARIDRLGVAKTVLQLGATVGRAFSYELLQELAPFDEATLRQALTRLVDAELLYQQGTPPEARYFLKHALIQESAYQALLKGTRQQYHQRVAEVLQSRFPETAAVQPELLAYHYTEAGLQARAIPYWRQAGERAITRSAHVEATEHLRKGLEALAVLPETAERARAELEMHILLGPALMATKGQAAPEVEQTYARAYALCRQVDDTAQRFPVLRGLWYYYLIRGELQTAHELSERLLPLAQRLQDDTRLTEAHWVVGVTQFLRGEFSRALTSLQQSLERQQTEQQRSLVGLQEFDVGCLCYLALVHWYLGYAAQSLEHSNAAVEPSLQHRVEPVYRRASGTLAP
jgi:class 3 adenylate cyclase/tetratricopeptide (TPR) repeat protein